MRDEKSLCSTAHAEIVIRHVNLLKICDTSRAERRTASCMGLLDPSSEGSFSSVREFGNVGNVWPDAGARNSFFSGVVVL